MTTNMQTVAEQSGYRHTGRTDEVEALCAAFAQRWPEAVSSFQYGRSVEGRPLRALLATRSGALSADALRERGIPLLMVQAGIHPGESDGKDAGFIVLRELLSGALAAELLDRIAVLFVPAFNTDGHERTGHWNRPNQNGPEVTGWRSNARNLNLNRDYSKADSPEMQAMLRLIAQWDPLVCADMHVTDGADFEPDISLQVEPLNQGDPALRPTGRGLRDELIAYLASRDSIPLPFYPDLAKTDEPSSGFVLTVYSPRFSTGYFPQRNRFTVLVETHSWKPYQHRVRISFETLLGLAQLLDKHGTQWLQEIRAADERAKRLGGCSMVLDYASSWREPGSAGRDTNERTTDGASLINFRGYAYTRLISEISGAPVTKYDPATPQLWRVPLRETVVPAVTVDLPKVGYLVPAAFAEEIGARLSPHGIQFQLLPQPLRDVSVESFRASAVSFGQGPYEGRMRATLFGEWREEKRAVGANSLFVPIAQSLSRLVAALFEPLGPDSFAAWGFFNACFEQKEQLEPYVAEMIAQDVMQGDPHAAAAFRQRLGSDPAFAASPMDRLEFLLRRHPSWDDQLNLYPIMRLQNSL